MKSNKCMLIAVSLMLAHGFQAQAISLELSRGRHQKIKETNHLVVSIIHKMEHYLTTMNSLLDSEELAGLRKKYRAFFETKEQESKQKFKVSDIAWRERFNKVARSRVAQSIKNAKKWLEKAYNAKVRGLEDELKSIGSLAWIKKS